MQYSIDENLYFQLDTSSKYERTLLPRLPEY